MGGFEVLPPKLIYRFLVITLATLGFGISAASAAVVTIGSLSTETDGSSEIIDDSLNNRQWLRWDVLADLTYAQTVAATSAGGSYEDYSIATAADAALFLSAFGSTNANCTSALVSILLFDCGATGSSSSIFGDNFNESWDYALFQNADDGFNRTVGFLQLGTTPGVNNRLDVLWNWAQLNTSDRYATGGLNENIPMSWLLYKDVNPVPIPGAVWLFGTGLIGLIGFAKRKKANL